jgi:hypothetical protein
LAGSCYTLDVNHTSGSRVKVRLYETRAVEAGGNILLLQGQLSVRQFETLEALFLAGARGGGAEIISTGRYYALPRAANGCGSPTNVTSSDPDRCMEAASRLTGGQSAARQQDSRPRAPWITGPVIGPNGVMDDDDGDDYNALAARHLERMLRRRAG